MKHTSVCAIAALITCLPLTAVGGLTIDRINKTIGNTKDYDDIKNGLNIQHSYKNHDDSVGSRGNSNSLNGTVVVNTDSGNADNNLKPINCDHAAYKDMCDELKDFMFAAMEEVAASQPEPEPEVEYAWKQIIYSMQVDLDFPIPKDATKIRYKLSDHGLIEKTLPANESYHIRDSVTDSSNMFDCSVGASVYGSATINAEKLVVDGSISTKSSGNCQATAMAGISLLSIYAPK